MRFSWSSARARRASTSVLALTAALAANTGCTRDSDTPDARVVGLDAGSDAPVAMMTCTRNEDCNDGFACTIDNCGVGNRCEWVAIDSECPSEQTCVIGRGCVTGMPMDCMVDGDCDDGRRCTGREQCLLGMCRVTEPYTCDDGNACTTDSCGGAADDCVFTTVCDSGVGGSDTGPVCTPFDAASVYSSTFIVPMAPSQGCAVVPTYTASPIAFSVSGGVLTARATGFTMTQSPAPTGADFDVRSDAGCAHFRLTGTFTCGNQGTAMFTATFDPECSICMDQSRSVMLLR